MALNSKVNVTEPYRFKPTDMLTEENTYCDGWSLEFSVSGLITV